jgi:hypothetical protein
MEIHLQAIELNENVAKRIFGHEAKDSVLPLGVKQEENICEIECIKFM